MTGYDYTFKICIFTGKDVGKKSLAKRFSSFEEYSWGESKGVHFLSKTMQIYDKKAKLQYWLLFPDNERVKFLIPQYILTELY